MTTEVQPLSSSFNTAAPFQENASRGFPSSFSSSTMLEGHQVSSIDHKTGTTVAHKIFPWSKVAQVALVIIGLMTLVFAVLIIVGMAPGSLNFKALPLMLRSVSSFTLTLLLAGNLVVSAVAFSVALFLRQKESIEKYLHRDPAGNLLTAEKIEEEQKDYITSLEPYFVKDKKGNLVCAARINLTKILDRNKITRLTEENKSLKSHLPNATLKEIAKELSIEEVKLPSNICGCEHCCAQRASNLF